LGGTFLVTAKYAGNLRRMFELEQGALDAVKAGRFDVRVPVISTDEFSRIADGTNDMIVGLKEKEQYRTILGKVVSGPVAKRIVERGLKLGGGETVEATVLFTDLRDYTALSEKVSPQQLVAILNEYFTMVNAVVEKNGGFVNKFIGDSVMAVYGLDQPEGSCEAAVRTALDVRHALLDLNKSFEARGLPAIANGIGVHHGPMVAGVIGAEERVEFTVIGDTVNTAARLESLTKSLQSFMAISKNVYERIPAMTQRLLESLGEHPLKGKSEKLAVYGLSEAARPSRW
jgi:adenylate cyclase